MRATVAILFVAALLMSACEHTVRTAGILPHDMYVWQRAWTRQLHAGIEQTRGSVRSLVVLAAEISVSDETPQIVRPAVDFDALLTLNAPVGLAVRIGSFGGSFAEDDSRARAIVALVRERVAAARARGLEPAELQIDFDCADSKLAGYRKWLGAVRETVKPLPVSPTVLPSWLAQKEFEPLARECGGYILQVHSVSPPKRVENSGRLTEPQKARAWVERAGRLGVPFRVALPTYSYLVAYDAAGKMLGISAEGVASAWPAEARVVRWEAEPTELAALVAGWTRDRPKAMTGLIWYRLPVDGDTLNWRWPTFAAVAAGRAPARRLRVEASSSQPSDIVLINEGEQDEVLPARIEATSDVAISAVDALAGYALERPGNKKAVFVRERSVEVSRLPPGARRNVGWIRSETPSRIDVQLGIAGS